MARPATREDIIDFFVLTITPFLFSGVNRDDPHFTDQIKKTINELSLELVAKKNSGEVFNITNPEQLMSRYMGRRIIDLQKQKQPDSSSRAEVRASRDEIIDLFVLTIMPFLSPSLDRSEPNFTNRIKETINQLSLDLVAKKNRGEVFYITTQEQVMLNNITEHIRDLEAQEQERRQQEQYSITSAQAAGRLTKTSKKRSTRRRRSSKKKKSRKMNKRRR